MANFKIDRFLDRGIQYYFCRVFWDDSSLLRDLELAGYKTRMIELLDKIPTIPQPVRSSHNEYNDLVLELNLLAKHPATVTQAALTNLERKMTSFSKTHRGLRIGQDFHKLFNSLKEYESVSAKHKAHKDPRTSEELVAAINAKIYKKIEAYGFNPEGTDERSQILRGIKTYLDTGKSSNLATAVARYDTTWLARFGRWLASFVYTDEVEKTYHSVKRLQESPFFKEALANLAKQKERERDKSDTESLDDDDSVEASPLQTKLEYEYDAKIQDFKASKRNVHDIWQAHRVTKQAFKETLEKMSEAVKTLESENKVALPKVPFPDDILSPDHIPEDATVFSHIQHCIDIFLEKVNQEKMEAHFQSDCADLQNGINRILSYAYQGRDRRRMLTPSQRSVCTQVGIGLTKTLNRTQKELIEQKECLQSVKTVREEIVRLMAFHNGIAKELSTFKDKLGKIDQGEFFNDIEYFIEKPDPENNVKGPLQTRQAELQALLDSLSDCGDEPFNVLAPKGAEEKKVCEAVHTLRGHSTLLANELLSILKEEQTPDERHGLRATGTSREYASVGHKENDRKFKGKFREIMKEITEFSSKLLPQETSSLGDFFGEDEALESEVGQEKEVDLLGLHDHSPKESVRHSSLFKGQPKQSGRSYADLSDDEEHEVSHEAHNNRHKREAGGKGIYSKVSGDNRSEEGSDDDKATVRTPLVSGGKHHRHDYGVFKDKSKNLEIEPEDSKHAAKKVVPKVRTNKGGS